MDKIFEIQFTDLAAQKGKTKFGGQPDWLDNIEWPVSESTGNPMRFICQIDLAEIGYTAFEAKFAYLFMTDEDEYVDGTWEPDGGENAVILQPGKNGIKTTEIKDGPSLYQMVEKPSHDLLVPQDFACSVILTESEDKAPEGDTLEIVNKFGGKPVFIQDEEYPSDNEDWKLLLQLDSVDVPFSVNFGDSGVGYAFIRADGKKAKFLWQCM